MSRRRGRGRPTVRPVFSPSRSTQRRQFHMVSVERGPRSGQPHVGARQRPRPCCREGRESSRQQAAPALAKVRVRLPALTSRWPQEPRGRGTDDLRPVVAELHAGFRAVTGRGRREHPQLRSHLGEGGGPVHRGDGRCAADRTRRVLGQDSWCRLVTCADWHRLTFDGHKVEPVTRRRSCHPPVS